MCSIVRCVRVQGYNHLMVGILHDLIIEFQTYFGAVCASSAVNPVLPPSVSRVCTLFIAAQTVTPLHTSTNKSEHAVRDGIFLCC